MKIEHIAGEGFAPRGAMEQQGEFDHSELVISVTGADNVCERAVCAYGCEVFLLRKTKKSGMTLALGVTDVIMEYKY